jgi:hypothetical protein
MHQNKINITISLKTISYYVIVFILAAALFAGVSFVFATTPNPGHPWTDIGNGFWQASNSQTALRTFTFPDADATILTSAAAVTVAQGGTGWTNIQAGAIPYGNGASALATTSAGTAGFVLALLNGVPTWTATSTLANISGTLGLTGGGTNAALTASNGGIVWSNASQLQILGGTATAGQILRSGSSAAPAWSAATYPGTAGSLDNVLTSDGTNFVSLTPTTTTTVLTRSQEATGAVSASAAQSTVLTIGTTGLFNVPQKMVVNQLTIGVTIGGTTPSYTAKVCIYNAAGTQKYIDVTTAAMTATGVFSVTVSPAVTLYPGNYYVFEGLATQSGTTPTLTFNTWTSTSVPFINGASIPAGKIKYEGTIASRTSGACDANLFSPGVLTNVNNATPMVRLDN